MRGHLVAIRIDEVPEGRYVTGIVAQAKNRKRAWSFMVTPSEYDTIREKVEYHEKARNFVQPVLGETL